jgi:hypothetical protein
MKGQTSLILLSLALGIQSCVANNPRPTSNSAPQATREPEFVSDELLVLFKDGTAEARITAINTLLNVHVIRALLPGRSYLVQVPKGRTLEEIRRAYFGFPEVEEVELNYEARIL